MTLIYRLKRELSFGEELVLSRKLNLPVGALGQDDSFWYYTLETERELNSREIVVLKKIRLEPVNDY
ncbi:MAG: hypothetical protein AABX29_03900 [Nanoarchaeota archaeon]